MLTLNLSQLPASILGIYGPGTDMLPDRMRFLHPDAAASYLSLEAGPQRLRVSDMWRSAESSLQARREKRGVQPPGHSGHNFGFSIDLDVDWMLSRYRWSKEQLDLYMNQNGWFCYRRDHLRDAESWHFNFFGADSAKYMAVGAGSGSTAAALEQKIQDFYGAAFQLTPTQVQTALQALKLYTGAIDGAVGPLSAEAIRAFQRTWELPPSGTADPDTQRLMAFVTADRQVAPLAQAPALVA
jgi:hypothetical protein